MTQTQLTHEVQIDTQLAELYEKMDALRAKFSYQVHTVMKQAGAKYYYRDGERVTNMTFAEAFEILSDQAYARDYTTAVWELRGEIAAVKGKIDSLEEQYTGWSRFFIVRNTNGHIHSSLNCSTCFPTTSYGWLPTLSGLSEKDAVEAQGAILCSICFPSAPVEWTNGISKEAQAAKDERAAAKAARDAKKAANDLGQTVVINSYTRVSTLTAAKTELNGQLWYGHAYASGKDEHFIAARKLAEAIAAKTGQDATEVYDTAEAKQLKKIARGQ